jgi:hypothetical protein
LSVKMYADHGDEDVCGCYWALKNADKIINNENKRIRDLVNLCDKLDTTAGSFETGDTVLRRRMAWMFKPYHNARYNNRLGNMDDVKLKRMIRKTEGRISEYVNGKGGEVDLKGDYEVIGVDNERNTKNGWVFTREHHSASRMMMYLDGIDTFVSLVGTKKGGFYTYAYGKKTNWNVNIDFRKVCRKMNEIDKELVSDKNYWGGTPTRGGSLKMTGSKAKPEIVDRVMNECAEEGKAEVGLK